jgi:lipopolysaccharide/colanic/teichoic acid biosynthesis glycosyltransferase
MSHYYFPIPSRRMWEGTAVVSTDSGRPCGQQFAHGLRVPPSGARLTIKRALDLALSLVVIFTLFPLMVLASVAVKLDSPGPVILRRGRHGFDRREFTVYTFRTTLINDDSSMGGQSRNDRVTRVGRVLRSTGIDKLPQFFNVLLGDMSVVGPPLQACAQGDEYAQGLTEFALRHRVKPGIVGLKPIGRIPSDPAQVNAVQAEPGGLEFWYINNWSIWLDLRIGASACLESTRSQISFEPTIVRQPRDSLDSSTNSSFKWLERKCERLQAEFEAQQPRN